MKFQFFLFLFISLPLSSQYTYTHSYFATDHAFLPKPNKMLIESKMLLYNQVHFTVNKNISLNGGFFFDATDTPINIRNVYPQIGAKAKFDLHQYVHLGISSIFIFDFNIERVYGINKNHIFSNQVFITIGTPKNHLTAGQLIYSEKSEGDSYREVVPFFSASVNIKNEFNIIVENLISLDNASLLGFGFSYQKNKFGLTFGLFHSNPGFEYHENGDWRYLKYPALLMRYYLN